MITLASGSAEMCCRFVRIKQRYWVKVKIAIDKRRDKWYND